MWGEYSSSGRAVGRVEGLERLCEVLSHRRTEFDAVALASIIDVPERFQLDYYESRGEIVNPWGGVEAMLTHAISMIFDVPSAHAPMVESMEIMNLDVGVVDPPHVSRGHIHFFPLLSPEGAASEPAHCPRRGDSGAPRCVNCG